MSNSSQTEPKLQPVHRIFLGELFVFVFFFAGALSVLVGPFAVPLKIAAIAIGASMVCSVLSFLWLAFTTLVRKPEPRYAFMALSLMPAAMICTGVLVVQSFKDASSAKKNPMKISVLSLKKFGADPSQLTPEQRQRISIQLFSSESAALIEELRGLDFDKIDLSPRTPKFHARSSTESTQGVILLELIGCDSTAEKTGEYHYNVELVDSTKRSELIKLKNELLERWTKNMAARNASGDKP